MEGTFGYKREHGLTVEQKNAIDLLVLGKTDREVAESVGVNRVTVTKWRNYDVVFQAELNRQRAEVWGASVDRLRSLLPRALEVLEEELQTGPNRGRVAVDLLRITGLDYSSRKGSSLQPSEPTDPDAMIESMARAARLEEAFDSPVSERERATVLAKLEERRNASN